MFLPATAIFSQGKVFLQCHHLFSDHQCSEPVPSVDNAYVTYNGTYYADTATVTCDTGYEYPDGSVIQTTQCLEVGDTVTWTPVQFSYCQSKAIAFVFENPFPWCFACRKFPRCYYVHLTRCVFCVMPDCEI